MSVWNAKMAGQSAASGQVSVNSAFTWSLLLCNGYQFCSSNVCVLQHRPVHALNMSKIIGFVYLGLQFEWNQLSSNNFLHTNGIHKGLHAVNWPDLITSKPDPVSILGYQWTDYTGTTLADAITQWCPSGNPVLICITGTHWKTTGRPLEAHWLPTIPFPVTFQCTLGGLNSRHTGLPLAHQWITTSSG